MSIRATLALIAAALLCTGCQGAGPTSELLQCEQAWTSAMSAHDSAALENILAAEFRLTWVASEAAPPGMPEITRAQWLDNLQHMTFGRIDMRNQRVSMQGERVAAVRMKMTLHNWKVAGRPLPPNYDLTDIWVHRDGRWQVTNRISEPLDPPTAPPPGLRK